MFSAGRRARLLAGPSLDRVGSRVPLRGRALHPRASVKDPADLRGHDSLLPRQPTPSRHPSEGLGPDE